MRKRVAILIWTCIVAIVIAVHLEGCSMLHTMDQALNTPPDIELVQQNFQDNYANIQVVVEFMLNSGYEDISIRDADGTMFADLSEREISDDKVSSAISQLIDGKKYHSISKRGDTIKFLQWKAIRDIGCGIAYSTNKSDKPDVSYVTELIPLSEDGWYYYVADYERWRSENSTVET